MTPAPSPPRDDPCAGRDTRSASGDRFRAVFAQLADIPGEQWGEFSSRVYERQFAPRDVLIHEGHPATSIHFIVSGLVRLYYNEDGRELVRGFDYEGRFVAAYESVLTGKAASFSVQALEPTRTLAFTGEHLRTMYGRHPCWDRVDAACSRRSGSASPRSRAAFGCIALKSTITCSSRATRHSSIASHSISWRPTSP